MIGIMWQRFERQCNSDVHRKFYKCFEDAVQENGLVSVLRHGFKHRGMQLVDTSYRIVQGEGKTKR